MGLEGGTRSLGPASVVVASAGVAEGGPFLDTRGYFLQIASLASIGAAPVMSAYCASKVVVESFSQALRPELAPRGAGTAHLKWTDTGMIRDVGRLAEAVKGRASSVYVPGRLRTAPANPGASR